ncbi:MAG: hypothetical protein AAF327_14330, partial [Cyanobacteria bacterium P01_A01_bin.37]
GRPKKDEKPLMPTLSAVVGKSIRTIQNYLKEEELESTKDFALSENCIKKAIAQLKKFDQVRGRKKWEVKLSKRLPDIIAELESGIDDTQK